MNKQTRFLFCALLPLIALACNGEPEGNEGDADLFAPDGTDGDTARGDAADSDVDEEARLDSDLTGDANAPDGEDDSGDGGSLADGDTADSDAEVEHTYTCELIGNGDSDGFFALETFGDHLYAGQFGYGREGQSMLYRYPQWERVEPGIRGVGESICAFEVFDGSFYANTEHSGDIFRSSDGESWQRIYDGPSGAIGCGMAALDGSLYAINYNFTHSRDGRILRMDGSSFTVVYDSGEEPLYIREIVTYNNTLYAFAVNDGTPVMLSSEDGTSWHRQNIENRYLRGLVHGGFLWLGSTSKYSQGQVGLYRFDGETFTRVTGAIDGQYVTDIEVIGDDMFLSTSNGWKEESGPSHLLHSRDGGQTFETVCTFAETAIWSMAVFEGQVFLGTWDFGHGGAVHRAVPVPIGHEPESTAVDCSPIAANPAWEICDSSDIHCSGVFSDGAGCAAFCAAAGLSCFLHYGGEPGCTLELDTPLSCAQESGHTSDWCECRRPQ